MNKQNLTNILKAIHDMITRNRVAYKDYIGTDENGNKIYDIKLVSTELLPNIPFKLLPKTLATESKVLEIVNRVATKKENPEFIGSFSQNRKESSVIGSRSHAEGNDCTASGDYSHAEGTGTIASARCSHAEGTGTIASGRCSHVEGNITTASGEESHAEGYFTIASSNYQHVQGRYNIVDSSDTYANIVGNGSSDSRSNAHTLDWEGNAWYSGTIEGKALILPSSTSGSTKKFKITVDDSGTISATEVTA